MPSPVTSYTNGLLAKFDRYATWPPNSKLRLGDIGVLEGNQFRYQSNLEAFGLEFGHYAGPKIDLDHSSGFTFISDAGVGGQAIAGSVAKGHMSFDQSGAFVFQAKGCRDYEISDKLRLANELSRLYQEVLWDPKWVVIENLTEVERATIILVDSEGGTLEVSANAGFPIGSVPLASVEGNLKVMSRSGDFTTFLAEQKLTPLFQLLRVKRSWIEMIKDAITRKAVIPPVQTEADVLEWQSPAWRE